MGESVGLEYSVPIGPGEAPFEWGGSSEALAHIERRSLSARAGGSSRM